MKLQTIVLLGLAGFFFCCKSPYAPGNKGCAYTVDASAAGFSWTAFKFTKRTGVTGTFDDITYSPGSKQNSPAEALNGLTFHINAESINTGNPGRDEKIKREFFGKIKDARDIHGRIDYKNGKLFLTLSYNGMEKEVPAKWEVKTDSVSAFAVIQNEDWQALNAVDSLNKACMTEHRGEDGISKLWPDVEIKVEAPIKETCTLE